MHGAYTYFSMCVARRSLQGDGLHTASGPGLGRLTLGVTLCIYWWYVYVPIWGSFGVRFCVFWVRLGSFWVSFGLFCVSLGQFRVRLGPFGSVLGALRWAHRLDAVGTPQHIECPEAVGSL